MAKYQLIIEGNSIQELMENLKNELHIASEQEERAKELEKIVNRKTNLNVRKKKAWTEFEDCFLVENYKAKKIAWIAEKLSRPKTAVYARLHYIRKTTGELPLKINKSSKVYEQSIN